MTSVWRLTIVKNFFSDNLSQKLINYLKTWGLKRLYLLYFFQNMFHLIKTGKKMSSNDVNFVHIAYDSRTNKMHLLG